MTDNEIIKALNEADGINEVGIYCADCEGKYIAIVNVRDVIDLINSLKAEIERLEDILYDDDGVNLVNYWHQQCKIAENGCKNFAEENESQKAEIERLKDKTKRLQESVRLMFNYDDGDERIKAAAVKEFAERLKVYACFGNIGEYVMWKDIDNLVKELTGDKKELCSCFHEEQVIRGWEDAYTPILVKRTVCWGTKETEECSCGGDKEKCNFYKERS